MQPPRGATDGDGFEGAFSRALADAVSARTAAEGDAVSASTAAEHVKRDWSGGGELKLGVPGEVGAGGEDDGVDPSEERDYIAQLYERDPPTRAMTAEEYMAAAYSHSWRSGPRAHPAVDAAERPSPFSTIRARGGNEARHRPPARRGAKPRPRATTGSGSDDGFSSAHSASSGGPVASRRRWGGGAASTTEADTSSCGESSGTEGSLGGAAAREGSWTGRRRGPGPAYVKPAAPAMLQPAAGAGTRQAAAQASSGDAAKQATLSWTSALEGEWGDYAGR